MHDIIDVYIQSLRPKSSHPNLFLNTLAKPLGDGEASRFLTKYFKSFGLTLSGATSLRKVLSNTFWDAANDGIISKSGKIYILFE
jgi:hypothetical protein